MKSIRNKKATQINQTVILSILSIIFLIFLLIFGYKAYKTINDRTNELTILELQNGIASISELLAGKYGTIKQKIFKIPYGVDTICFVDLNHSFEILEKTSLVSNYPMINDSLSAGGQDNMFLIENLRVTDSMNVGDICFDYFPYYACIATQSNIIELWFEGKGGCTTIFINWSMFPDNEKDFSLYENMPVFIIEEERNENIENWREILAIIPLSLFRQSGKGYRYDFATVYKLDDDMNSSELQDLMKNEFNTNKSFVFNTSTQFLLDAPYIVSVNSTSNEEYFNFWINFTGIIAVDYNNEEAALTAALLAAYVNSPLLFIDENNLDRYKDVILNRELFIVTHGSTVLDTTTFDYIKSYAKRYQLISDTLLQSSGEVSTFADLHGIINII